jgi:uncharacterized protein GlcG (DUF336 family)
MTNLNRDGRRGFFDEHRPRIIILLSLAFVVTFGIFGPVSAVAQVDKGARALPLTLAMKAAMASINSCERSGYSVSVVIVDTSGVIRLEAKGDHSTIHTTTSAYRKAYTVVTLGPIYRFDKSSEFSWLVAKNADGEGLASLPNITPLAGGVAIRVGDQVMAALGVSGSPGGGKDEVCAEAGAASIQDDLEVLYPDVR